MLDGLREFRELAYKSFPVEPVPVAFFWSECEASPFQPDIPGELQKSLANLSWRDVLLRDWLMIGAAPCIARSYLEPATFLYYLPSLLVGVLDDLDYLDWALEGILPFNKTHKPRGKWWATFSACVTDNQRATLQAFLMTVRSSNPADLRDQALLGDAEVIWGS